MNKLYFIIILALPIFVLSQKKEPLNHKVYNNWESLGYSQISNNGTWVSFQIDPQKGDGKLIIKNPDKNESYEFSRGNSAVFSTKSDFIVFKVSPQADSLHLQKFKKIKKDKQYKDSLFIKYFKENAVVKFPNIKKFSIPKENTDVIYFLHNKAIKPKKVKNDTSKTDSTHNDTLKIDILKLDTAQIDTTKKDTIETAKPQKIVSDGTKFCIYYPKTKDTICNKYVNEYDYDSYSKYVAFISNTTDSLDTTRVYLVNIKTKEIKTIFEKQGKAKKINVDINGENLSFIFSADTAKPYKYSLYHYNFKQKKVLIIADTIHGNLPKNYDVSPEGNIYYSKNSKKLFFGIRPVPVKEKEDSLLDSERCRVDIWSWTDNYLQPQQLKQLKQEKEQSYLTVYNLKTKKVLQLADTTIKYVRIQNKGNSKYAIGTVSEKYAKSISWDINRKADYYIINTNNGEKELIFEASINDLQISPNQQYLYFYNENDSNWYAKSIKSKNFINITKNIKTKLYNEEHDTPSLPDKYGIAGWIKNDKYILIYDKYDIWKVDPLGKQNVINITNGRKSNLQYIYNKLDYDNIFIEDTMLLKVFNIKNKQNGFYSYNVKTNLLSKIIMEDYDFYSIKKAKYANKYTWRKRSFTRYPEFTYGTLDIKNGKDLSNLTLQQEKYNWATVELTSWVSYNGDTLEGLLYKPEDFDENKKYPMIVYFYEKYSNRLHRYYSPSPSRSTINFTFYASNGYIIFVPDINYEIGNPGDNAYNAIVSGTKELMKNKWVDKEKIGIQGQSWGGYQVAYLITRTNLYAAGMAGAPVSNMTSAYGGIRWSSGMSRMFQYEQTQSRIGATLWERQDLYIKNSPVFFADKVKTPLLIMHNDNDGAVPWYQGIEYFVALRRLNKPVWLLNYNGDSHNLYRRPNMIDLSIRMNQFFDTYLKDKPAPNWMKKGVKAINKGEHNAYKLLNNSTLK